LGLLSDAAHNLSDVFSLGLSYGAYHAGKFPSTQRFTFAYKRTEVLVALFNSVLLIGVSGYILIEGIKRLVSPMPVGGPTVILIAGIGMVANTAAALLLKGYTGSANIKSSFLHLVADAVTSLGVVISGAVIWMFGFNAADAVISILLALWMIKEALSIARSTANILMEGMPDGLDFTQVAKAIYGTADAVGVHDLHIWAISSNEYALSAHLVVEGGLISEASSTVSLVKEMLKERFSITHATLEVECDCVTCTGGACPNLDLSGAASKTESQRKLAIGGSLRDQ
jgi:cobalt-zinc-cadmium efflux system protein